MVGFGVMIDFSNIRIITFDCYGTLIDWETGILAAMRGVLPGVSDRELLTVYSELEPEIQAGEYKRYRQVLRELLAGAARRFGANVPTGKEDALAESIAEWKPFPDTVAALRRLKSKYRLAVISNIDDDLFACSAKRLEVPFDHVITAQQAGAYKPSLKNFETAEKRIGTPRAQWVHVPARKLGIASVWVNRRGNKAYGATKVAEAKPDLEVPDLQGLANAAGV
jgi:2-haloacid dehalogenase